jgi:hypothetical protein
MEIIKSEIDANTAQLLAKKEALHALETDFEYWRGQQVEIASLFENLSQIAQQYLEKGDHYAYVPLAELTFFPRRNYWRHLRKVESR